MTQLLDKLRVYMKLLSENATIKAKSWHFNFIMSSFRQHAGAWLCFDRRLNNHQILYTNQDKVVLQQAVELFNFTDRYITLRVSLSAPFQVFDEGIVSKNLYDNLLKQGMD